MKNTTKTENGSRSENWQGMNWCRQSTRLAIYLRDGLACAYCGHSVEDGATLSLDHVTPVSKGGGNQATNLVTCCARCNSSRGNRSVADFAGAVAGYLNHGATADEIIRHVRNTTRRALPRAEARKLIERRGSVASVLASR